MNDPFAPLEEALRSTPGNVPLRLYLASQLASAGYSGRALDHYREAAGLQPGSVDAILGVGRCLIAQGEADKGIAALNQALGMDPDRLQSGHLHMEIAKALYFLGRIEDARHHFSAGIRDNPEAADADLSRRLNENEEGNRGLRIGQSERIPVGGGDISPSNFDGLQDTGLSFRDVGGMDALKETLRRAIVYPFRSPEIYRAYGRSIGGGILLYGPPGCGKTYIARATAGEIQARFISVGLSDIMDMWYGESERKLHDLFASARNQAPAVLFFDEVDALGHSRTRMSQFTAGRTLVNQFLAEMDGIQSRNENLLIIGATNSPWDVDPAFRRPGRFDRIIFVAPPDAAARVEILKVHCRNKPLDRIDFNRIVTQMDRFSGADIKNVCDVAADKALDEALKSGSIRKITTADFLEAIRRVKPSTSEWLETAHSYARYANTSGLYSEVEDYLQGR